jgi:hypothetical protein
MKKILLFILLCTGFILVSCSDSEKVADPEALYQRYLKDDQARKETVTKCKLLSVEDQLKSQSCTVAFKADGDKEMKKHGGVKMQPLDLSKKNK